MRAMRVIGLLLAVLLSAHGAAASHAVPIVSRTLDSAILPAASVTAQAQPAPVPAAPSRAPELDYLPKDDGRGGAREIGWLLIAIAIVLAIVIVVFVVRHRRTGRPG